MNLYTEGDLVPVAAQFTDASGAPVNPTTVTLGVGRPGEADTVTYAFGVGTEISNPVTGTFIANIDTTGFGPGAWCHEWAGTGTCQVTSAGFFGIESTYLP